MATKRKRYRDFYNPKNPDKYRGKSVSNIVYRSLWEFTMMKRFDYNESIVWWSSEELAIPYYSPVDKKMHRYFPDFIIGEKQEDGSVKVIMIEVKPLNQTTKPDNPVTQDRRKQKRYLRESITYAINKAKWDAAKEYCADRKWTFIIMTEKEIHGR